MSKESDSEKAARESPGALQRSPSNTIHDFTSLRLIENPHPAYQQLRRDMPVCWDAKWSGWLITRYEDVHSLLRHKMLSSNWLDALLGQLSPEEETAALSLRAILTGRLLFVDHESHRRVRNLMQLAFTPKRVQMMETFIQKTIDDMLDRALSAGEMDLIRDFALPFPSHVITAILGLPPEDCDRFKAWTDDIYAFIGATRESASRRAQRATRSAEQLKAYLSDLFDKIRRQPRDDLISAMIQAEEQGERLTETELFSNVVGMINASHETTTSLIGNTTFRLLQSPGLWQRLAAEPELVPNAVEEGLRYESPIQVVGRLAVVDIKIGEVAIRRGDRVILVLAAANRDPAVFRDPDRFDVTRSEIKHLAFGGGPHYCLGAPLGRLEGNMAIATLCRRLPRLCLTTNEASWNPHLVFRGLSRLPVKFA